MMKKLLLVLTIAIIFVLPLSMATAQGGKFTSSGTADSDEIINDAIHAYTLGHYDNCVKLLRQADRKNDRIVDYYWGLCYHFGHGVDQNYTSAFRYFQSSASAGFFDALYMTGVYYENAYVGEKDYEKAKLQYYFAATNGFHHESMRALGSLYFAGNGVEQDYEEAYKWFETSANKGNPRAAYYVGLFNEMGFIAEPNIKEAIKQYSVAVKSGNVNAMIAKGFLTQDDNPKEAADLFTEAAKTGNKQAIMWMAKAYRNGTGVEKNLETAIQYYGAAAQAGSAKAFVCLGDMYLAGEGIAADPATAANWYNEAVKKNDAEACYKLAMIMMAGNGIDKNEASAKKLIDFAASKGYQEAVDYLK
jgi:TPR repeat protein